MSENKWAELDVTFRIVTEAEYEKVHEFLHQAFFPDEPVFRSTKLVQDSGTGFVSNFIANLIKKHIVMPCLKDSTSILALNKNGEIIGARYVLI